MTATLIGERIKQLREKKKMTQNDVAIAVDKSRSDIAAYETKGTVPHIETIAKLADLFHVSIDYLAGRTEDPYQLYSIDEELTPEQKQVIYRLSDLLKEDLRCEDLKSAVDFLGFLSQQNMNRKKI
ncbi:helix-turn-helix domain-containing protein [Paenibacillus sp. NPDC058071]|uniref:helix-turn-helix domain-containing protein n=1 Tax=Paenibacillus sp. NPDC058071 TaxID=3346326 RepID=UPI0036D83AF0